MKQSQLTLIRSVIYLIFPMFIFACKDDKVGMADPSEDELTALNEAVLELSSDSTQNAIQGTAAKGETWESWDNAFNSCFQDQTFKKNKVYLGPSNLKYIGTILSKDKSITRRDLKSVAPIADLDQFIIRGVPVANCDFTKVKDLSIGLIISAAYSQMNADLNTAVSKYDSVKVVGGQWQVDELRSEDFLDYLNAHSDNPKVAAYKKSLLDKKNFIITKVVKVTGFRADIYSNRNLSVGLQAELQTAKVIPVATPDSTNHNLNTSLSFSSSKRGVVSVSSNGQFYIYGMVQKGKEL